MKNEKKNEEQEDLVRYSIRTLHIHKVQIFGCMYLLKQYRVNIDRDTLLYQMNGTNEQAYIPDNIQLYIKHKKKPM